MDNRSRLFLDLSRRPTIMLLVLGSLCSAQTTANSEGTSPSPQRAPFLGSPFEGLPTAPGAGLFVVPPGIQTSDTKIQLSSVVTRMRVVSIDRKYLANLLDASEVRIPVSGMEANTVAFTLNLFDGLTVRVVKTGMKQDELGHIIWHGIVIGEGGGEVTLVIDTGNVTGEIRIDARHFRIIPTGNGSHHISEYRASSLPHAPALRPPRPPDGHSTVRALAAQGSAAGPIVINVLVAYTQSAMESISDISSAVSLAISDINETLSNSGLNVRIRPLAPTLVNYDDSGKLAAGILNDATEGGGDFSRIQQLRSTLGADLVSVWANFSDYCGLAWQNDLIDQYDDGARYYSKWGYNVLSTAWDGACLASDDMTHEAGHNMGGGHDRYVVPNNAPGPAAYNYGYVDLVGAFRDTMAYDDQCSEQHVTCPRIPFYSNPNINYLGRPVGIPDADAKAADNARRIGELAPYVAQFHTYLLPPGSP